MMYFKEDNGNEYRFVRVNPEKLSPNAFLGAFPSDVTKEQTMYIAKLFLTMIGHKERLFLIDYKKRMGYEFDTHYDRPTFKESDIFQSLLNEIRTKLDFGYERAYECTQIAFLTSDRIAIEMAKKQAAEYEKKRIEEENKNPNWIPVGYHHVTGNLKTGYVVADEYGNEFTYIPYMDIYISRYEISRDSRGNARSIPGMRAWVNVKYREALTAAETFDPENNSTLLGSLEQIIDAIKMAKGSLVAKYSGKAEIKTGTRTENMDYNIDCLIGNHFCMLKTKDRKNYGKKIDGASYLNKHSGMYDGVTAPSKEIGFRICLKK